MKPYAESFYKSTTWQKTRELCIHRAGGLCERCLKEGLITPAVVVHHIKPITPENINDPNITLNQDNLMALCVDCHAKIHHPNQRRYKIDKDGRVCGLRSRPI